MDFQTLPTNTEHLLESLGYTLSADRSRWCASSDFNLPASGEEPDRLAKAAAARMSEISPEKNVIPSRDLNCGLWPDNGNIAEEIDDGIHRQLTGESDGEESN